MRAHSDNSKRPMHHRCTTLHIHIIAEGEDDGLNLGRKLVGRREHESLSFADGHVNGLQDGDGDGEGGGLSGLGLSNDIPPLCNG
jgi:hypothetical protein